MIKKIGSFLWGVVEVLIVCYVIFMTLCIISRNKFGFTQFGNYVLVSLDEIRANNLETQQGNLLVLKKASVLKKGDVIYYYAPDVEEYVVSIGEVTNIERDGNKYLISLGNRGKTISSTRAIGTEAKQYKSLGTIKDILESKIGFLFLVLLPIMIVFIYQIYRFVIVIKYENNTSDDDDDDEDDSKKKVKEVEEVKDDSQEQSDTKQVIENKTQEITHKQVDEAGNEEVVTYKEEVKVIETKNDDDIELL